MLGAWRRTEVWQPRWPPWPSAENFIDYADLAHVAGAGVVVGYLVDESHASAVEFRRVVLS